MSESMVSGRIIKGIAGFYYVHTDSHGVIECHAKGILRRGKYKRPLVGDRVDIEILDTEKKTGSLVSIHDRTSSLIRPEVANVDQALIVMAYEKPEPNLLLLDRFLVMLENQNVECIICFNKSDMADDARIDEIKAEYADCGFPLISVSAKYDDDFNVIKNILEGKITAFAGPSGVGKSSIINRICPEALMETGSISHKTERGKHTTRHSEVFPLGGMKETYIMDTPGFTSIELMEGVETESLRAYYREFYRFEGECKYDGCSHTHEPGCSVKQAVEEGKISRLRYGNYKAMYDELKSRDKKRY